MLAVVYVPGLLLLGDLIARLGAFATVFQRDYSPLLTCTAMAWTAAQLPIVLSHMDRARSWCYRSSPCSHIFTSPC